MQDIELHLGERLLELLAGHDDDILQLIHHAGPLPIPGMRIRAQGPRRRAYISGYGR